MPTKPPKSDQDAALLAFIGEPDNRVVTARRSSLELAATCPAQFVMVQQGKVATNSHATEVGQALHDAMAQTIQWYIETNGLADYQGNTAKAIVEELEIALQQSRPDIQNRVVDSGRACMWSWARYIANLEPWRIFAFDGGEKLEHPTEAGQTRTGQLAWDIPYGDDMVRVTAEVDLLHATDSPEVLRDIDYKSGWKPWDYAEVSQAFQFSTHAFLVFNNFEEVNYLDMQVWSTRRNALTPTVRFDRRRLPEYTARVMSSVREYVAWNGKESADAWPYPEKCAICPCATICPEAALSPWRVEDNPEAAFDQWLATKETMDAQKKELWAHVDRTGEPIRSAVDSAVCFGYAPKTPNKQGSPVFTNGSAAAADVSPIASAGKTPGASAGADTDANALF